ncbi:MAG TPA: hypothetical protein V6D48_23240 [Oculatellaceae cyanobacterium]
MSCPDSRIKALEFNAKEEEIFQECDRLVIPNPRLKTLFLSSRRDVPFGNASRTGGTSLHVGAIYQKRKYKTRIWYQIFSELKS